LTQVPVSHVSSGGCRIAFREVGDGPPLLLVMGLGASGLAWQDHVGAYSDWFHCIIPDNRGVGQSAAPPGPYTSFQMAEDCAAVMQAVGCGPAAVAGISMGGIIAQELCLRHPALVQALVMVSSWCRADPYLAGLFRHLRRAQGLLAPEDFTQLLQLLIWSPKYQSAHIDSLRQARQLAPDTAMSRSAFGAQCDACIGHDSCGRLATVTVPTLITEGEDDLFTLMGHALQLRHGIAGSQLEVLPGGHAHHWEQLDDFNSLTRSWLTKHVAGATQRALRSS
jgi:pimeloyl-ACP methyl ester carboxylesterase